MNKQWQTLGKLKKWSRQVSLGIILGVFLFVLGRETAAFFARETSVDGKDYPVQETKVVALTFDDGPHEKWTLDLLDGLKERGVKVTFFLMGENIEGKEELVQRMAKDTQVIISITLKECCGQAFL